MRICALADPHAIFKDQIQPSDLLVVAGDLTLDGSIRELSKFRQWLAAQPAKHKVVVAGNHDFCLDNANRQEAETILGGDGIVYLRDQLVSIDGIKIYGSPWQPWFHDWAFNLMRGRELQEKWKLIPYDVDILLVHGPPYGFGDRTMRGERVGCEDLIKEIELKRPRVVCYGHIHEDVGEWNYNGSKLINCSVGYEIGWNDSGVRGPFYFDL